MSNQVYRKTLVVVLLFFCFSVVASAMSKIPSNRQAGINDFKLVDLNGKSHSLSDYKGKVVFLNFWASWCPPCRQEMPSMQKLYQTWDKNKYVMLAVNIGESKAQVQSFASSNKYTFPILLDTNRVVAKKYNIRGIPATFIIDSQGKIAGKIVGSREWTLEEVKRLLK